MASFFSREHGSRAFLASLVVAGSLLSACGPSSETSRVPTLSVIPSGHSTLVPSSENCVVPTVQPTKEGPAIRAMTTEELTNFMNSKIEDPKKKIGIIIPLQEPVPVASLTLVGACINGGCLPIEAVAGSGMIDAVALSVGAAAEIGYVGVVVGGYLAPVAMMLGNSVQGAMEGYYEINPQTGQMEQVSAHQGQYDRAKAVIEFFRDSRGAQAVKFQGREIARVAVSTSNVSSAPLTKEQVEGKMSDMASEELQTQMSTDAEPIPNDLAVAAWGKIEPKGGNGSGGKRPEKREDICKQAYEALSQKFGKSSSNGSDGISIDLLNQESVPVFGGDYDWGDVVDWMKLWCGDSVVIKPPISMSDSNYFFIRKTTPEENNVQNVRIAPESDLSQFSKDELVKWLRVMHWYENTREGYRLWQTVASHLADLFAKSK